MKVWIVTAYDGGYQYPMGVFASEELAEKDVEERKKADEEAEYPYDSYHIRSVKVIEE